MPRFLMILVGVILPERGIPTIHETRIPVNQLILSDVPWFSDRYPGIPLYSDLFHGIPLGIPEDPLRFHEVLPICQGPMFRPFVPRRFWNFRVHGVTSSAPAWKCQIGGRGEAMDLHHGETSRNGPTSWLSWFTSRLTWTDGRYMVDIW